MSKLFFHMMLTTVEGLDLLSAMQEICRLPFSGEETGMPLGKYIDDLVFLRAKQLLMDRSVPISQISQQLGFCDQFYFSRRFKEKSGQTPTEFRKDAVVTRT